MKIFSNVIVLLTVAACSRSGVNITPEYDYTDETAGLVQLCGNPALLGQEIGDVIGQGQCGIPNAVSVEYAAGVRLSQPAKLNCGTANTLANWLEDDAQDAVRSLRGRITGMRVLASYACRSRNSQPGARLSEHALGNAIDVAGFDLSNGDFLSVEESWGIGREGAVLEQLHATACGPFGTVLGPLSDRFHYNHFHLDTASYRSGSYCE